MRRKLVYWVLPTILISFFLVWLLLIRVYDVRFKFKVSTLPDIALVTFKTWAGSKDGEIIGLDYNNKSAIQKMVIDGEVYTTHWTFQFDEDSTTIVYAALESNTNRFFNRVGSLLFSTPIKQNGKELVSDFYEKLSEHLSKLKVQVVGKSVFDEQLCICLPLETTQLGKAGGMMENYSYISEVIGSSKLEITGSPLLEIEDWDQKNDILVYNFCFPVKERKVLNDTVFFFKKIQSFDAIKAVYNGNYINSDRAWYALKHYASEKNIKVDLKPLEIFRNNPNIDREEIKWKADIFMPLSK